jgi:hypothetical protein
MIFKPIHLEVIESTCAYISIYNATKFGPLDLPYLG